MPLKNRHSLVWWQCNRRKNNNNNMEKIQLLLLLRLFDITACVHWTIYCIMKSTQQFFLFICFFFTVILKIFYIHSNKFIDFSFSIYNMVPSNAISSHTFVLYSNDLLIENRLVYWNYWTSIQLQILWNVFKENRFINNNLYLLTFPDAVCWKLLHNNNQVVLMSSL